MTTVEQVAENVWTKLIARVAMIATPLIVAMTGWLMFSYLDNRFSLESVAIFAATTRLDHVESLEATTSAKTQELTTRTAVVENNQVLGRARVEHAEEILSTKLDSIQSVMAEVREKVATVSASVDVLKARKEVP